LIDTVRSPVKASIKVKIYATTTQAMEVTAYTDHVRWYFRDAASVSHQSLFSGSTTSDANNESVVKTLRGDCWSLVRT
jgi:hypothetical protein